MKIVLASNNKHKIKEFKDILKGIEILSLNDIGFNDDIIEDGETFLENALIKAKTVSQYLKSIGINYTVLADDSGLCVNSLGGNPGIYSARYAGNHDDKANRDLLIKNLSDKEDKSAYFICLIVKYKIDDTYDYYEGKTMGKIIS